MFDQIVCIVCIICIVYSASGLVVPRTEEQISAPIAVKKFKRPLISGWEGPSCCPKCSKLCYDQFGVTLEASNHPHLFTGRLPPGYWLVIGIAAPAQLMQQYLSGSPTPIFPNFAKSYFSTLSTYIAQHCKLMLNWAPAQLMQQYLSGSPTPIFPNFAKSYFSTLLTYIAQHCILMLNGAISYFLAPVFHTFLSHHCCSAAHWQSMCGGTEVQKNVILTKIRSALLYFYPYSIYFSFNGRRCGSSFKLCSERITERVHSWGVFFEQQNNQIERLYKIR